MAESRVNLGAADAVERDLRGMADTELVVDLLGSGDDAAYGLAERGIRSMQRDTEQGELYTRIRNLGADLGPNKGLSGSVAIYNPSYHKTKDFGVSGSRGPVTVPPQSILINPGGSTADTIRHEQAHHGFSVIRPSLPTRGDEYVESEFMPVPMDALSKILAKGSSSDAEHLLIESLDAASRLKTGYKLPESQQAVGRLEFDDIARYMNEPSDKNRKQAIHRIQQALSNPSRESLFDRNVYNTAVRMLKEDGVFSRKIPVVNQILPYQLLDSLMQASMNFNTKPDLGYGEGGPVQTNGSRSRVDMGEGAPLPSEQLSFGVAGYGIIPKIHAEGGMGRHSRNPFGEVSEDEAYGKFGVEVVTPEGRRFGIGRDANYFEGKMNFNEEAQFYGAPGSIKYGTDGVEYGNISGYYESPEGYRVEGSYNPETDDYRVYGSKVFNFAEGGGIGSLSVGNKMINPEILAQIERIMGR